MHGNQPSITAENNAALRTLESMRPANERICFDPYAKYFVSDTLQQANNIYSALVERVSDWEKRFPGTCDAVIARTRFIDDCLEVAVEEGLEQLVVLGAGYDTRALRFERLKGNVAVFELDHPATQKTKLKRYRQNLRTIPDHIVFIPVNFEKEEFDQKLFDHGYSSKMKSFFIWEGMTYYVPASAIDKTLSFISDNAPEGSSVVFDYIPPAVANGTSHLMGAVDLRASLKKLGEEFVFGIDPDSIKKFLIKRGFDLVKNLTAKDCRQLYFKESNRNRRVSDMFVFAQAKVREKKSIPFKWFCS